MRPAPATLAAELPQEAARRSRGILWHLIVNVSALVLAGVAFVLYQHYKLAGESTAALVRTGPRSSATLRVPLLL